MDFYWGCELYPRILGFDIKVWTNCRMGMMGWGVLNLAYAYKQLKDVGYVSDSLAVSVCLQLIYICKVCMRAAHLLLLVVPLDVEGTQRSTKWHPSRRTRSCFVQLVHCTDEKSHRIEFSVFLVGDRLLVLNRYHARQSWVLPLLGLPCLGSMCVHFTLNVPLLSSHEPWLATCFFHLPCWLSVNIFELRQR